MIGEIIQFPQRESESPERETGIPTAEFINHVADMVIFLSKQVELQPGSYKRRNVDLRQETLLEPMDNEQLISVVNKSNEHDWAAHPAYYHAVIRELMNRNLIPKKSKDSPEE